MNFSGYASLFGVVDFGLDVVEPGAFARSLLSRGADGVRMLYNHKPDIIIGAWAEIAEDDRGLFVRGALTESCSLSQHVGRMIRDRELSGLSIGFRTIRAEMCSSIRRIIEIDIWEISIVAMPMLYNARITATFLPDQKGDEMLSGAAEIERRDRPVDDGGALR